MDCGDWRGFGVRHLKTREEVLAMLQNNEMIQSLMIAPLLKYFMEEKI